MGLSVRSSKVIAFACMMLLLVATYVKVDAFMSAAFWAARNQAECCRATATPITALGMSKGNGSLNNHIGSRRDALLKQGALIFGIFTGTDLVNALDIDAFMNSEVSVKTFASTLLILIHSQQYFSVATSLFHEISNRLKRIIRIVTQN